MGILKLIESTSPEVSQNEIVVPKNSFTQDEAHQTKSAKFVPLTPSETAAIMADHGMERVSLKMGRARLADREAHQNVTARYRPIGWREGAGAMIDGLWLDIVALQKHIYGADQFFVGTFRQICGNGLTVGQKFVTGRVVHLRDAASQLNALLPRLIAQHDQLVDCIRMMQARNVTPNEIAYLTRTVANLRLASVKNVSHIEYGQLIKVRRNEDAAPTLWNVFNILDENNGKYGFRYQTETADPRGDNFPKVVRNALARPTKFGKMGDNETVRSVEMDASIWDVAMDLLNNKAA